MQQVLCTHSADKINFINTIECRLCRCNNFKDVLNNTFRLCIFITEKDCISMVGNYRITIFKLFIGCSTNAVNL